jgi:hypothetical protein
VEHDADRVRAGARCKDRVFGAADAADLDSGAVGHVVREFSTGGTAVTMAAATST